MKKLILAAFALTTAAGVFAQGTVVFNNRVTGSVITHVYAPLASNPTNHTIGNGSADTSAGGVDWSTYTAIGLSGTAGQYGGATTFAALLGANGTGQPESSLQPGVPPSNTFRTGAAAGFLAGGVTETYATIQPDAPGATVELVAWDNSSGLYSTWSAASAAWAQGLIAAGRSNPINVGPVGGTGAPPNLIGLQSFNMYFIGGTITPEPSTFALAGLGAASLLIFRRRK